MIAFIDEDFYISSFRINDSRFPAHEVVRRTGIFGVYRGALISAATAADHSDEDDSDADNGDSIWWADY